MPINPLKTFIQHLLANLGPDGGGMTDGDLLARFLNSQDDNALVALVRRHAPMVWGVCCRLLHNHHDAEDAFQATFLVLVHKAAGVPKQAVGNWLYGVARQTAVRLRAATAKRGRRERQVVNMPEPTMTEAPDADLLSVLDEELSHLPDHYRGVIVLCELEGMTRRAAARQLGIPEGSVASRLARARVMLAKRLTKRGVEFSGGPIAVALSTGSASASAPPALLLSTSKAASLLAAGQAAGVVSAKVAALTAGVLKAMFLNKLRNAICVLLMLATIGLAASGLAHRTQAADPPEALSPSAIRKQDDSNLKETVLALEKRIFEAYKTQDRAAFQSLLADDFEGVNPRGYLYDRASELKYVSNFCTTEYELKDAKVILLTRNSALVTYEVHYKVRPTGAERIIENTTSHRTAAWVQRNSRWWRVYVEDRVAQK